MESDEGVIVEIEASVAHPQIGGSGVRPQPPHVEIKVKKRRC